MNTMDMTAALIQRAKQLQKFTVETEVPDDFRFNGTIPFDIKIADGIISAEIYALTFNEACQILDDFLGDAQ